MKIIVLAAGKGERLWPLTKNTPKPLLDLGNGNTLIEEQIGRMGESGVIDEVVLVVGYLAQQVEAKIQSLESRMKLRTLYNPFYGVSNNLMSLWLAKAEMTGDFMVTNGDNLFAADVFSDFLKATDNGIWLALGRKDTYEDDDMKVSLDGETITRVSKEIPAELIHAESPGLSIVRGARARELYVAQLEALARRHESIGTYWLEVYNQSYRAGVAVRPWFFETRGRWQEVDFHQDVAVVRQALSIRLTQSWAAPKT